ncbi:MAG: murein biosynthesis integral membrane protein MurJ [Parachlamydiaceae bacterium]|nr:murein biosynthesis integral membrane protein MurJ [Parachlamydiaceae bacterium]
MQDTTHTILHSAKRFFSGTLLSRFTGLGRDISLAYAFGADSALAAFLVAFRFAHLLRRLLGEGAFQTAFIPTFEELRHESSQRAGRFFVDLYGALTLVLIAIIGFCLAGGSLLLGYADLSAGNAEIISLTLLMLPSLLFICLFGLNASLLQCEKYYFLPAFAPTAFNLFWILGALSLKGLTPEAAMPKLALFINAACFCQWLVTAPTTWNLVKNLGIKNAWKHLHPYAKDLSKLSGPLVLGMLGVGASQINNALDAVFARYASLEGPAYLWYAIRIQQLPLGLIGIALSGALLPALSRAIKSDQSKEAIESSDDPKAEKLEPETQNPSKFRHLLSTTSKNCFLLMLPMTVGMFLFGRFGIQLLYGHGDFDSSDVTATTYCLWGYALGLIPMALVLILAPGFYAQKNYRLPMQASIVSMLVNVALNSWFVFGLNWGPTSVAIATSLSAWLNYFWLAYAMKKQIINI